MTGYLQRLTTRMADGLVRLPEATRARHARFLRESQLPDGSFPDRDGGADLYYTGFALRGLAVLGALTPAICRRAAGFLGVSLAREASIVDFFSLLYSCLLVQMAGGPARVGIDAVRKDEARKNAGDPGQVLPRRLSIAEYNYTIRDLTGADIRPAREFPVDPANPAGFDNSGESLAMSPALMTKYLQAPREVANHLVFKPQGMAFAPCPMLVETDRDKYCVQQILDFY